MLDPTSALEGLGFGITSGYVFGRLWRPRRNRPPKPVRLICGCDHHFSHHDENGKCHYADTVVSEKKEAILLPNGEPVKNIDEVIRTNAINIVTAEIPCTCQRYTGPDPMPTIVADYR